MGALQRRAAEVVAAEPAFPPTDLDDPLKRGVKALDRALRLWEKLEPLAHAFTTFLATSVEQVIEAEAQGTAVYLTKEGKPSTREAWARSTAGDLAVILEKYSRSVTSLTKTVDEAARLRAYLTRGEEEPVDMVGMSDQELIELLVQVALGRGLWRLIQARGREMGVIEAEVVSDGPAA